MRYGIAITSFSSSYLGSMLAVRCKYVVESDETSPRIWHQGSEPYYEIQ
jgi:hypothetical protein